MNGPINPLQIRELFHLECLRALGRRLPPAGYAVKGGVNLRLFFRSCRYSEDMDLDVFGVGIESVKKAVMGMLGSKALLDTLKPFGIRQVVASDLAKAKQTQTAQRFKVHLITVAGEDLFTKIEFSRRGMQDGVLVEPIPVAVFRPYQIPSFLASHYDVYAAVSQKIGALAGRSVVQARDIFDLYVLNSQVPSGKAKALASAGKITEAVKNLYSVTFEQFRDTVVAYLDYEDQAAYASPAAWDGLKLQVAEFLEGLRK